MTDWTIYNNTTPWLLLSEDQRNALMAHHESGGRVEEWDAYGDDGPGWSPPMDPFVQPDTAYRAIAMPDQIDWTHVADWVLAIARDEDGRVHGYDHEPKPAEIAWIPNGGADQFCEMFSHASYRRGTCDWRNSLMLYPGAARAAVREEDANG